MYTQRGSYWRRKKDLETDDILIPLVVLLVFGLIKVYYIIRHCIGRVKSKRVGAITKTPVIPFPQDNLHYSRLSYLPQVKILRGRNVSYLRRSDIFPLFRSHPSIKLHSWMQYMYNVEARMPNKYEEYCIPCGARTISIKKQGFKHGDLCHEFVPADGMILGYFEYQMFGDNRIQATYYIENGKKYVAGFCIYVSSSSTYGSHYNEDVVKKLWVSEGYPMRRNTRMASRAISVTESASSEEEIVGRGPETLLVSGEEDDGKIRTVRYCQKSKRHMVSSLENQTVVHEDWDSVLKKTKKMQCDVCTQDNSRDMDLPPDYSTLSMV